MDVKFWRDDPKFTQEDLHKLDQWLQEFLAYRSNEERYLEKERTYKVNLFNYLATSGTDGIAILMRVAKC